MIVSSMTIGSLSVANTGEYGYHILLCAGLESPEVRLPEYNIPEGDGSIFEAWYYGKRVISMRIRVFAETASDYIAKESDLLTAINLYRFELGRVTFVLGDGTSVFTEGICTNVERADDGFGKPTVGEISFEIHCPNAILKSTTASTATIYLPSVSGGFAIPTAIPISIGAATYDGTENCDNNGNYIAYPTIVIYGECENPYVTNLTTGKSLQFNVTNTSPADYISIDVKNYTAVKVASGVTTSVMQYLDADKRDFFPLIPGSNLMYFDHEGSYSASAQCVITWNDSFSGK